MKNFGGPVLFLDRSDINTDEIIPAKYLNEIAKEDLKPFLLEDLRLPGFDPQCQQVAGARVIVTKANFGCGSSREHAPWALEVNDINVVIAESFARIFRQNMFNCGMLALALPALELEVLFGFAGEADTVIQVDFARDLLKVSGGGKSREIRYTISDFDRALVEAGGWVEFADRKY